MKLLVRFFLSLSLVLLLLGGYANHPTHTYQNRIGFLQKENVAKPVLPFISLTIFQNSISDFVVSSRIKKDNEAIYTDEEDDDDDSAKLIPSRKFTELVHSFAAFFSQPLSGCFSGCIPFYQYFPGTISYRHLVLCVIRV